MIFFISPHLIRHTRWRQISFTFTQICICRIYQHFYQFSFDSFVYYVNKNLIYKSDQLVSLSRMAFKIETVNVACDLASESEQRDTANVYSPNDHIVIEMYKYLPNSPYLLCLWCTNTTYNANHQWYMKEKTKTKIVGWFLTVNYL